METIVNYWAIITGAVLSMIVGALWYGPIFGKKWMEIVGVNPSDIEARKEMQKSAGPLYFVQFLLTLLQVFVFAYMANHSNQISGIALAIAIWAAFIIPTLAGAVMWTNEKGKLKRARFIIQGGYQLVIFIIFGMLIHFWK